MLNKLLENNRKYITSGLFVDINRDLVLDYNFYVYFWKKYFIIMHNRYKHSEYNNYEEY